MDPGTVVDSRYRIIELLGKGGMGTVYRAEHVHIRREVALKLLRPVAGEYPQIGARFEREARAIGKLDQINCVAVNDFGQLPDSSLYLAMELVEGTPLDRVIDPREPMPWRRAVHIARHVLAGLEHAHAAGIVHRDVKPENIILTERDGDPDFAKILDFGLAKLVSGDEDHELTQAGTAFGTPTYIAPEQAVGDPVDGRADLYALSCVLYELLTGRPPFTAEDKLSLLAMHTGKAVPPMPESAGVPPAIEQVVRRGLAKKKDERFPDAAAYRAAIDRAIEHPSCSTPVPTPPPTRVRRRRRWLLSALGVAAGAAVVVIAVSLSGSGAASPTAAHALELLGMNDPEGAVAHLGAADIAGDAEAQLVLGHARAELGDHAEALDAYRAAVRIRPDLSSDERMRDTLVELATHRRMAVRTRAREFALGLELNDRIDLVESYTLDLRQGKRCRDRKPAVAALRELGDKRAIGALERARYVKGGMRFDRKNLNACLADDARDAIEHLESLPD